MAKRDKTTRTITTPANASRVVLRVTDSTCKAQGPDSPMSMMIIERHAFLSLLPFPAQAMPSFGQDILIASLYPIEYKPNPVLDIAYLQFVICISQFVISMRLRRKNSNISGEVEGQFLRGLDRRK